MRSKESVTSAQLTHRLGHHPCRAHSGTQSWQSQGSQATLEEPPECSDRIWSPRRAPIECFMPYRCTPFLTPRGWACFSSPWIWTSPVTDRPVGCSGCDSANTRSRLQQDGSFCFLSLGRELQCGESSCLGTISLGGSLSWPSGETEIEAPASSQMFQASQLIL